MEADEELGVLLEAPRTWFSFLTPECADEGAVVLAKVVRSCAEKDKADLDNPRHISLVLQDKLVTEVVLAA